MALVVAVAAPGKGEGVGDRVAPALLLGAMPVGVKEALTVPPPGAALFAGEGVSVAPPKSREGEGERETLEDGVEPPPPPPAAPGLPEAVLQAVPSMPEGVTEALGRAAVGDTEREAARKGDAVAPLSPLGVGEGEEWEEAVPRAGELEGDTLWEGQEDRDGEVEVEGVRKEVREGLWEVVRVGERVGVREPTAPPPGEGVGVPESPLRDWEVTGEREGEEEAEGVRPGLRECSGEGEAVVEERREGVTRAEAVAPAAKEGVAVAVAPVRSEAVGGGEGPGPGRPCGVRPWGAGRA